MSEMKFDPDFWAETNGWQIGELPEPDSYLDDIDISVQCVLDYALELDPPTSDATTLLEMYGYESFRVMRDDWQKLIEEPIANGAYGTQMPDAAQWFMGDGFKMEDLITSGKNLKIFGHKKCSFCGFGNAETDKVCWMCGKWKSDEKPTKLYARFFVIFECGTEASAMAPYQHVDGEWNWRQSFFWDLAFPEMESISKDECQIVEWDGMDCLELSGPGLTLVARFAETPSQSGIIVKLGAA